MGMGRSKAHQTARVTASTDFSRHFAQHEFGMDNFECQINAKGLDDCTWDYTHDCRFTEGVWLSCEINTGHVVTHSRSTGIAKIFLIVFISLIIIILCYCYIVNKTQLSVMKCCSEVRSSTLKTYQKVNEVEENAGSDVGAELSVTIVSENEAKLQKEVDQLRAEIARLKAGGTSEKTKEQKTLM